MAKLTTATTTTHCVQAHPDGRRVIALAPPRWRFPLAAALIGAGILLGVVALFVATATTTTAAMPVWLAPLSLVVVLAGVATALWPPARVVIEPQARRVHLAGHSRVVDFDEVRGVVLFTAVPDAEEHAAGNEPRARRSVYVLTRGAPRKHSHLRREIARWGAHSSSSHLRVVELEAEAAAVSRDDDPAMLEPLLMHSRERLVAHTLTCPGAWTLARQLALTLGVPLLHHAGHLAVLEPSELKRPLTERLQESETSESPSPPPQCPQQEAAAAECGLYLASQGHVLQAQWFEPRLANPGAAAWLLAGGGMIAWLALLAVGLAEGALAEAWQHLAAGVAVLAAAAALVVLLLATTTTTTVPAPASRHTSRFRTAWGLALGSHALSIWRSSPEHEVERIPTNAITDLLIHEHHGQGLALVTAGDYVLLPMKRKQAITLREALRAHLATLTTTT